MSNEIPRIQNFTPRDNTLLVHTSSLTRIHTLAPMRKLLTATREAVYDLNTGQRARVFFFTSVKRCARFSIERVIASLT